MKKWLLISIPLLACFGISLFLLRSSRPTIHHQPPSVRQSDIDAIEDLVRAQGDRHFRYIAFSTLDSNAVQVCVSGGIFHRDHSRLFWIRRFQQAWQVERVGAWEKTIPVCPE